ILLERVVVRDGWTTAEALETMRVNHGIVADEALKALCLKLAKRGPAPQTVTEEEAGEIACVDPGPEAKVVRAELDFLVKRVQNALDRARQSLGAEERLILKMRFEDSIPVADIARALHLNQKRLYRTIERVLARL